ncbi:hypothetical protein ACFLV0_04800 [Chloroflexota bacterium]
MPSREEFTEQTKRTVGQRAAYLCSNPGCRVHTIGPHSQPKESLSTGVTEHICAASPGGPRFDASQTQYSRTHISNAIWLCHACSDLVDKDPEKYTREVLNDWKLQHEKFISEGGGIPQLPEITLSTQPSLTLPPVSGAKITGEDIKALREHALLITNPNARAMEYLKLRIQFPEPIIHHGIITAPAGVNIQCEPEQTKLFVTASGSGSVIRRGNIHKSEYIVSINTIPPNNKLELQFISIADPEGRTFRPGIERNAFEYHIVGEFQYLLHGEHLPRHFLVLLEFDLDTRRIHSLPSEESNVTRKILHRQSLL